MNKRISVRLLLAASLGLNLLVVGVLAGRALNPDGPPPPMAWAVRDVDEQTYRRLRPMLHAQMEEVRPLRLEMRGAMRAFAEVLEREPLDVDAASQSLAELRAGSRRYQEVLHRNMLDILDGLTPAERRVVVRSLLHRGGRAPCRPGSAPRAGARPAAPPAPASPGAPSPQQALGEQG